MRISSFLQKLEFDQRQMHTFVNILEDMGQVCAAGILVPYFVDSFELTKIMFGLLFTSFFFIMALRFSRKVHDSEY